MTGEGENGGKVKTPPGFYGRLVAKQRRRIDFPAPPMNRGLRDDRMFLRMDMTGYRLRRLCGENRSADILVSVLPDCCGCCTTATITSRGCGQRETCRKADGLLNNHFFVSNSCCPCLFVNKSSGPDEALDFNVVTVSQNPPRE